MTTATKEKTKTREQDLEEQIARHEEQFAKLNAELASYEQQIIDAKQRIQDLVEGSFDRPTEGFAEDVDAARRHEADGRARAEIAHRRMDVFLAKSKLEQLKVELGQLQSERRDAEIRVAAEVKHKANIEEYYARVELLDDLKLQATLEHSRCRQLITEINASIRQHHFDAPAGYDMELFKTTVQDRLAAFPQVTLDGGGGTSISFHRTTPEQLAQLFDRIVATGKRLSKTRRA